MKNRSRIALLVVMLFMLGTISITAYQSLSKIVTVIDDGKVTQYETDATSVDELLKQLNITLETKDIITPSVDTPIDNNLKITIERWKPTVNFTLDGQSLQFKTGFKTVGDIIKAKNLQNEEGLIVEPSQETMITDNMKIVVKTTKIETVTEEQPIAYNTVQKETKELKKGETKIEQAGKNGTQRVTMERTYVGNELVSETVKETVVVVPSEDEIILIGAKDVVKDTSGISYEYTKMYNMEATAYTAFNGDGWGDQTASGMRAGVGIIAVDPKVIPLGTKLFVEGYGLAIAGDTGGAIKGHIVDLFFETKAECREFGRRQRKVYVLADQTIDVLAARNQ
ncbi:hypothetical protein CS063_08805 [Sporanaerobium hydrogeniformans]|uniref:Uncharacterized protein n=1 Tax=Sporanaerobium hydrogeniformans TaxID=3072179 RepID=A0AC61DDJ5_9FIRM|nr:3D domain-containing protein [Sporanaerobium hydrogeniformans]PHV70853.1 hypothetical protein CS063_08805 [Sporanaerobium hydrogeniformans]